MKGGRSFCESVHGDGMEIESRRNEHGEENWKLRTIDGMKRLRHWHPSLSNLVTLFEDPRSESLSPMHHCGKRRLRERCD